MLLGTRKCPENVSALHFRSTIIAQSVRSDGQGRGVGKECQGKAQSQKAFKDIFKN